MYGTQGLGLGVDRSGARRSPACPIAASTPRRGRRPRAWTELKRINPIAQIPTLVLDDGSVLSESAAILIHLGLPTRKAACLPSDPARRAQQIRGLVYIAANCYAGIGILDYPERWYPDPDDAVRRRCSRAAGPACTSCGRSSPTSSRPTPWLSGERLGALDILAATVSKWSGARKALAESRPRFAALLARIDADPRIAPVWARHWPEP